MEPINIFDYAILARERMNPVYWDYYEGGSDDEVTIRANQADFARIRLRPRMLVDVTHCDTSTSVLGIRVPMPILVARTSMHCLAHPDDGAHGVQQVLEILRTELERAMKLAGCPTLASINRELVRWME